MIFKKNTFKIKKQTDLLSLASNRCICYCNREPWDRQVVLLSMAHEF